MKHRTSPKVWRQGQIFCFLKSNRYYFWNYWQQTSLSLQDNQGEGFFALVCFIKSHEMKHHKVSLSFTADKKISVWNSSVMCFISHWEHCYSVIVLMTSVLSQCCFFKSCNFFHCLYSRLCYAKNNFIFCALVLASIYLYKKYF